MWDIECGTGLWDVACRMLDKGSGLWDVGCGICMVDFG